MRKILLAVVISLLTIASVSATTLNDNVIDHYSFDHGYVDTFRQFNKEPDQYTWLDMKTRARDRNVGWRIDYFFVNKDFLPNTKNAFIMKDVLGSDHCPIGIEIDV